MRGPADIIAAMRGADKLPIDLLDSPDTMKRVIEDCTNAWIEVAKAQLALIPDSDDGYMDGDRGFRFWAPDRATWLQEDAMALLSPQLYHDFFLPADRRIATEFPAIGFHLHGSALWSVDDLLSIPEMDVIELNFEAARADIDATFAACRKIQSAKPLVVWRQYDADLWPWLDRVTRELSTKGLSMQITVANLEEARELTKRFYELKWQHS